MPAEPQPDFSGGATSRHLRNTYPPAQSGDHLSARRRRFAKAISDQEAGRNSRSFGLFSSQSLDGVRCRMTEDRNAFGHTSGHSRGKCPPRLSQRDWHHSPLTQTLRSPARPAGHSRLGDSGTSTESAFVVVATVKLRFCSLARPSGHRPSIGTRCSAVSRVPSLRSAASPPLTRPARRAGMAIAMAGGHGACLPAPTLSIRGRDASSPASSQVIAPEGPWFFGPLRR